MGMYWCKNCKTQTTSINCQFCGKADTYKYWWSFPTPPGSKAPHGVKIYYNEDGTELRREEY